MEYGELPGYGLHNNGVSEGHRDGNGEVSVEPDEQGGEGVLRRQLQRNVRLPESRPANPLDLPPGEIRENTLDGNLLDASSDTASDGTDAALATLFTSVYTDLQRYAARRVGFNDAQDLASDTMVTAFERWSDAPPGLDRQRAWTFGILHHKISNFHQASARRTFAVADVPDAIDREEPPDDLISSLDRVRNLLAHLRPAERDTFTLIVEAGLSSAQAAEVLGCSVTAVTTRVSRAKRHLEKILNTIQREEGNDDGNP